MRRGMVLVLVLGMTLVGCGDDGSEPVDVAMGLIETWNDGDVLDFLDEFADDATIDGHAIDAAGMYSDLGFYMGLGQTLEVTECTPTGDDGATCTTTATDDLSGPLGVETPVNWVVTSTDGEVVSLEYEIPPGHSPYFYEVVVDAVMWVREAHPEVFEEHFRGSHEHCDPGDYNSYPDLWCSSIEGAAELLRLAEEFRAQYDV